MPQRDSAPSPIKPARPQLSIPPPSAYRPKLAVMGLTHRPLPSLPPRPIPAKPPRFWSTFHSSSPVLAALIACLDWPDVLSLLNTARDGRHLFRSQHLRDVILVRFVPGYAEALRHRHLNNYHGIPISVHDLDLLLISQRLPLHRYPTHALRTLTALYPTLEDDYITAKLIALSLAHSRFVLLLQALVHSSTSPVPPEPEDTYYKSHKSQKHHGRHLTFPAPLSYLKQQQQQQQQQQPQQQLTQPQPHQYTRAASRRLKHHSLPVKPSSADSPLSLTPTSRPSADSLSSMISINNNPDRSNGLEPSKTARRRSLFRQPSVTPPPPEEPRALRLYSKSWRRSTWSAAAHNSNSPHHHHQLNADNSVPLSFTDAFELGMPKRRFVPAKTPGSSDSSISSSPMTSASPLPRTGTGGSTTSSSTSSSPSTPPPTVRVPSSPLSMGAASPHDLVLATSRVRAPVLRVFVPCTNMETNSDSLLACEKYLVGAGLWEHLSTGDIVCNLGYIPPTSEGSTTTDGDDDNSFISSPTKLGIRGFGGNNTNSNNNSGENSRKWLLFNGEYLVPYTVPGILPINNPISLPSPFYYDHIMPLAGHTGNSTSANTNHNPRFVIGNFPPVRDEIPQLAMVNVSGKVRSTKSPTGWLEVKKWVWTARVVRHRPPPPQQQHEKLQVFGVSPSLEEELGQGWCGEWVLEGEGTSEGRQILLDILNRGVVPGGPREWELVRDRSGGGRIWLR